MTHKQYHVHGAVQMLRLGGCIEIRSLEYTWLNIGDGISADQPRLKILYAVAKTREMDSNRSNSFPGCKRNVEIIDAQI